MAQDFSGGAVTDLLHTIINTKSAVTIKNPKLLLFLNDALAALNQDLIDGDYQETDDTNDSFELLSTYFHNTYVTSDEDDDEDNVVVLVSENEDEDEGEDEDDENDDDEGSDNDEEDEEFSFDDDDDDEV